MARAGKPRGGPARVSSVTTQLLDRPTGPSAGTPIGRSMTGGRVPTTSPERWDADTAVERLYAVHWTTLVRVSVMLVRDQGTAEEVVQDAFVAMHGKWRSLKDPDNALAYLRRSVVNRSRSVLRHRKVVDRHTPTPVPDAPGADDAILAAARRTAVLDALLELPTRQREVIALRYYLDLSEQQIADALGISPGAVKSHASRGAAALRTTLEDQR